MKARVKATDKIIEVTHEAFEVRGKIVWKYVDTVTSELYADEELDFDLEENRIGGEIITLPNEPDYWDKLLHQYAGMAMQGLILRVNTLDEIVEPAIIIATNLVNKLKEE